MGSSVESSRHADKQSNATSSRHSSKRRSYLSGQQSLRSKKNFNGIVRRSSAVTDFAWKPTRKGASHQKTGSNPFRSVSNQSKSHVVTDNNSKGSGDYKYDARRQGGNKGWDPRFAKLGIAYNDSHGNYLSNVLLSAASGIQQRVGYAVPRGPSEFGRSLVKALNKRGVTSLAQALSKFSFRDIMGGGLWQKPIYQRAEKVGGEDFSKSLFNMSTRNKNNKDVKNVFLGACGNDGGNINFRGEMNGVAKAFKKKFGADIAGLLNNPSRKAIRNGLKRVADWAKRHKDKAVNLAFFYSGHGNWNHDGRKQGAATSWNQNFSEKWLKSTIAKTFKGVKNVGINLLVAACHAGGGVC